MQCVRNLSFHPIMKMLPFENLPYLRPGTVLCKQFNEWLHLAQIAK